MPFGPTSPTISPGATVKLTSSTAARFPEGLAKAFDRKDGGWRGHGALLAGAAGGRNLAPFPPTSQNQARDIDLNHVDCRIIHPPLSSLPGSSRTIAAIRWVGSDDICRKCARRAKREHEAKLELAIRLTPKMSVMRRREGVFHQGCHGA